MSVAADVDRLLAEVVGSVPRIQERTVDGLRRVAVAVGSGDSVMVAVRRAGVAKATYTEWRARYPLFAEWVDRRAREGEVVRGEVRRGERLERLRDEGLVFDPGREVPERPGLVDFRWLYFGQPTPRHQRLAVEALEDRTNLYVFVFGPTGMGKDTLAGQYLLWELAPTRRGLRGAWFMESSEFSKRRLGRLQRYLTDPSVYRHRPEKTPGGQVPSRSLLEDWGPFKWRSGMVHPDGSPVSRPEWTKHQMYFLQDVAPEQDPNLWATGVDGAVYGARIDFAVCSDMYTQENQLSPTERRKQYGFIDGTLDTRLDERGRLVVIGTMLPIENNYERMLGEYTAGARVISTREDGPATYLKYSNGVAVVWVKAIWTDEDGEERSYWPERFPLEQQLDVGGEKVVVDDLSDQELLQLAERGATAERGLKGKRKRSPRVFKAMFQQERDVESTGDFTEATLRRARDELRSYGVVYPHELAVIGADPARVYGAAYVVWAVDRREKTVTLADVFFGRNLGTTGIKSKLIVEPITRWNPVWFCYEVNRHSGVLDDTTIKELFRDFGVSVHDHKTSGSNRAEEEIGVGSLAGYMRGGIIRFPYAQAEDREKTGLVEDHFKAWDSATLTEGRSRPGGANHIEDDIAMAAWVGFVKARILVEQGERKDHGRSMPVPVGIRAKWERALKVAEAKKAGKDSKRAHVGEGRNASLGEVVAAFVAED